MSVVELRDYRATPGRMADLLARFRDHTDALFAAHGMTSLGYWIEEDDPERLVYLLRHEGDPVANWAGFRADERWHRARDASEAEGPLTSSIESTYLRPADFSTTR